MHSPFAPTETRRVLIVDDDPAVLDGLKAGFEMEGKTVVTSAAFQDARRRLLEEDFDLLATDVRLGAFNGLQLAVIARDRNPEMKIIVFSGFDDAVLQAEAARLRAHYLVKPVSLERLFEVIASL